MVCCIGYLTRYSATGAAHHSRLHRHSSSVEQSIDKGSVIGSNPVVTIENAKSAPVRSVRCQMLGPQGNQAQQSPQGSVGS